MSNLRIPAVAVTALLALGMSFTGSAQNAQQTLMRQCNGEANARHLPGPDRRAFMKDCLSSPPRQHLAMTSQQRRMRYCNARAKAKGLMGMDRKRFMSSCLKLR
jgi:hypothetical protein